MEWFTNLGNKATRRAYEAALGERLARRRRGRAHRTHGAGCPLLGPDVPTDPKKIPLPRVAPPPLGAAALPPGPAALERVGGAPRSLAPVVC